MGREGKIEIFAVSIENHLGTNKITKKEIALAVIGSPHATIGNSVIASSVNKYSEIRGVIGREHHADILHLERHLNSGRDYFLTDDNDFLTKKEELFEQFGVKVVTVDELEALVIK